MAMPTTSMSPFFHSLQVQVRSPRKQGRERERASTLICVTRPGSVYHVLRSQDDLLALWARAYAVLSGQPPNALLAALSIGRDASAGVENGGCECCGLHHMQLLSDGLRDAHQEPRQNSANALPKTRMLARAAPTKHDVVITSSRLRTSTFNAFLNELVAVLAELETQEALLRQCELLERLYAECMETLAIQPTSAVSNQQHRLLATVVHQKTTALDTPPLVVQEVASASEARQPASVLAD